MADVCAFCGKTTTINGTSTFFAAFGKQWHKDCFKCVKCGNKIFTIGKFYEYEGKPECATCYLKDLPKCQGCLKSIESTFIDAFNFKWHEKCFVCSVCGKEQGNEGFFEDEGKIYHLKCYSG